MNLRDARPRNQGIFKLYRTKLLNVCNHPASFSGQCHCGNGDIMYSVCHVTLKNYVIKGSYDFMEGSSSSHVATLPGLVAIGIVIVEIKYF